MEYSYKIVLPNKLSNLPQEDVYKKIKAALDKSHGNIFYTRVNGKNEDCIKYVYLTNTNCFSELKLKNGRFFDISEMDYTKFLSSEAMESKDQIGEIDTFDGSINIKVATLRTMIEDKYTLGGNCTITFSDDKGISIFSKEIKNLFNSGEVQVVSDGGTTLLNGSVATMNNFIVIGSLVLITMLLEN